MLARRAASNSMGRLEGHCAGGVEAWCEDGTAIECERAGMSRWSLSGRPLRIRSGPPFVEPTLGAGDAECAGESARSDARTATGTSPNESSLDPWEALLTVVAMLATEDRLSSRLSRLDLTERRDECEDKLRDFDLLLPSLLRLGPRRRLSGEYSHESPRVEQRLHVGRSPLHCNGKINKKLRVRSEH